MMISCPSRNYGGVHCPAANISIVKATTSPYINLHRLEMSAGSKVTGCLQHVGKFIFNTETKEIFGRTCISWVQIVSFFTVFYIVVGAIFVAHLLAFIAVTPKPGEGVQPWNYGKYAYPNYPNSKIALVAVPRVFKMKNYSEPILTNDDEQHIQKLLQSAEDSGVSSHCLNETTQYGFSTGEPCVFLHIARVFKWQPEYISGALENATFLPITCTVESKVDGLAENVTITAVPNGIPLTLANNNDSDSTRSFPFKGQYDYTTPVMAVSLNFDNVIQNVDKQKLKATITCGVDFDAIGIEEPGRHALKRMYEVPQEASIKITFKP